MNRGNIRLIQVMTGSDTISPELRRRVVRIEHMLRRVGNTGYLAPVTMAVVVEGCRGELRDRLETEATAADYTAAVEQPEQDTRRWVREHESISGWWHYFPHGQGTPAACGLDPIPGTPLVATLMPSTLPGNVCTDCARSATPPQPERTRLKWWREDGCWFAVTATRFHDWGIECTEQGQFVVTAGASGPIDPFPTLDEAKRRCQAEEDKLLTEQEGKSDV